MKIAVCVKQVVDTAARIRISGGALDDENLRYVINPHDEAAVEAAVRLREKNGGRVVLFTLAGAGADPVIRSGLAMGADRAVRIETRTDCRSCRTVAFLLAAAIRSDGVPDLLLTGQCAVDTEGFQTPYRLARFLDLPVAGPASALTVKPGVAQVRIDTENGKFKKLEMDTPCVVSASRSLAAPRHPRFADVMAARKKEIEIVELSAPDAESGRSGIAMTALQPSPGRPGPVMIEGSPSEQAAELIRVLRRTGNLP